MTVNEAVLQKLAEWRLPSPGRHSFSMPLPGLDAAATLTADLNNELGCMLWEATVRNGPAAAQSTTTRQWAVQIASRVSTLIERLKVIEIDETCNQAMLRSETPTQRGEANYYYELMLDGTTEVRLSRFQADPNGNKARAQVAFPITHETLAKLLTDLACGS